MTAIQRVYIQSIWTPLRDVERGRPEVPEGKGGSLDTHMEFYFDTYTLMSSESHWPINIISLKCFIESHLWHIYKLFFSLAPRESNDEKLYFSSAIEIDEDDKSYLVLKCFQVIKEKKLSSSNICSSNKSYLVIKSKEVEIACDILHVAMFCIFLVDIRSQTWHISTFNK